MRLPIPPPRLWKNIITQNWGFVKENLDADWQGDNRRIFLDADYADRNHLIIISLILKHVGHGFNRARLCRHDFKSCESTIAQIKFVPTIVGAVP